MVGAVVVVARVDVEFLGMEVENDVDDILIAPRYLGFVLLIYRNNILLPLEMAHPGQVHQHNSRIHSYCFSKQTSNVTTLSYISYLNPNRRVKE